MRPPRPTTWGHLPASKELVAREGYMLDFKNEFRAEHEKIAMHVAAFANALGGTILVGAVELDEGVAYEGVSMAVAAKVHLDVDHAVRDCLSPAPIYFITDIVSPTTPDRVVVAIAVDGYPDQPIGVRDKRSARDKPYWSFPVRIGAQTQHLDAAQLMLWTNPQTRRAAILLSRIPGGSAVCVHAYGPARQGDPHLVPARAHGHSIEENVLELEVAGQSWRVPLEDVASVWKDGALWAIRLLGTVIAQAEGKRYFPGQP